MDRCVYLHGSNEHGTINKRTATIEECFDSYRMEVIDEKNRS